MIRPWVLLPWVCLFMLLEADAAPSRELDTVGVSVSDLGNPFFVEIARGVEQAARRIGGPDTRVSVVSNSYDLATQNRQIRQFTAAGVDMIVLNAADPQGVAEAVAQARDAGVVVIAVDVAANGANATVTSDNTQAGETACRYLAERLEGKGRVVIINGPPVSSVIERVRGCRGVLDAHPGIQLLSDTQNAGGSREGGLLVMTALLAEFNRIDAVFAINDPTAVGADLAARQAERDEFFIVSVDGAPEAMAALRSKDSLLAATAAQNPRLMAGRGVELGYRILRGEEPGQTSLLLPTPLITRDTVDAYQGWSAH